MDLIIAVTGAFITSFIIAFLAFLWFVHRVLR